MPGEGAQTQCRTTSKGDDYLLFPTYSHKYYRKMETVSINCLNVFAVNRSLMANMKF